MSVEVIFTKGFGNNLFQYTFGRILAEYHDIPLFHKEIYNIPAQPVNIIRDKLYNVKTDWHRPDDKTKQFYRTLFTEKRHFVLKDYFEDYALYLPHQHKIQSWFPQINLTNYNDLVIHFRAGDALLYKDNIVNFPTVDEWQQALDKIHFNNLYVVTDSNQFAPLTIEDIQKTIQDICTKRGYATRNKFVSNSEGRELINKYINLFNGYNCKWVHHDNFLDDFNFMRRFNQILIGPSTFGWWAAFLSNATNIYVYQPWRRGKGERNKNLGNTCDWYKWGG